MIDGGNILLHNTSTEVIHARRWIHVGYRHALGVMQITHTQNVMVFHIE